MACCRDACGGCLRRNNLHQTRLRIFFIVITLSCFYAWCSFAMAEPSPLQVTLTPELRVVEHRGNEQQYHYVPATQVSQGGEIYYTVRIINVTNDRVRHAVVVQAIPANTHLIEDSATGAGAAISYSIDGGKNFLSATALSDATDDSAGPLHITHIRWQFHHALAPHVMVLARFRVVFD